MMVIRTREFCFPRPLYLAVLIRDALRRSWWAALFLVAVAVYESTQENSWGYLWLVFPVAYFGYIVVRCWLHAAAKRNPLFFADRRFEIDDRYITCIFSQGTVNKIEIGKIARVVKNSRYYRLFLNKKQFVYLPVDAFRTPGDRHRFEEILKARKARMKAG